MDTEEAVSERQEDRAAGYRHAGPTVPRMVLGAQLRRLREARNITGAEAGEVIRASHSKISRLEMGRTGFKRRDVDDLLTLYGVQDEGERATLLALARQSNMPGWWHAYYEVVPPWLNLYLGLEQSARVIRTYELQFVPGLLQTEQYARDVIRLGFEGIPEEELERRVELRMRRQLVLHQPSPPHLWAVIDEAALRRAMGSTEAMRAQLAHLIEMMEYRHITIQVMPFAAGGHAAVSGPVTVIRPPGEELPDVVYLEQHTGGIYPDKPEEVDHYRHVMNRLALRAEPPEATTGILRRILAET